MRQLEVKQLGCQQYSDILQRQQQAVAEIRADSVDKLWVLQHYPVYTLGQAGLSSHLLGTYDIPVVKSDRGGQVTYHAPGQLILYPLLNLVKQKITIKHYVASLQEIVLSLLAEHGIKGELRADAPGVYVNGAKIAALGLRVRHGVCYHGLSLNVDMDLEPFKGINPCGYQGMNITQTKDLGIKLNINELANQLVTKLCQQLKYEAANYE